MIDYVHKIFHLLRQLRGSANMRFHLNHTWMHRYSDSERSRINKGIN